MSYILDALKKSEKERKQGEIPDLNTIQESPPPRQPSNRTIVYLIIAILAVSIAGINLWVLFHRSPDQPLEEQPSNSTAAARNEEPAAMLPSKPKTAEKTPTDKALEKEAANAEATAQPDAEGLAGSAEPSREPAQTETQDTITIAASEKTSGVEAVTASEQAEETSDSPPAATGETGETETSIASAQETETVSNPEFEEEPELAEDEFESELDELPLDSEEKGDQKIVVAYKDLPSNVRNAMPELSIAAHFYSNNPSARMASINGRVVRQGQKIANGLTLEEIYDEGIICSFDKYRFRLKVFNP